VKKTLVLTRFVVSLTKIRKKEFFVPMNTSLIAMTFGEIHYIRVKNMFHNNGFTV
jgi:hypothetical protein